MTNLSAAQAVTQLNRVLDLNSGNEPALVFFIGAGGSGKSTLASKFQVAVSNDKIKAVKFDDAHELGMDRWEKHLHQYPDQDACLRAYVGDWIARIEAHHSDKKLLVCDVNTTPDILLQTLADRPHLKASIILVQPSEEVRVTRLANDSTREHMPKEALRAQFDSGFADFLAARTQELGIPRILNEQDDRSILQVAEAAIKLVREVK